MPDPILGSLIISLFSKIQSAETNTCFLLQFGLALGILIAISIFIYWPGITGPMVLDDAVNLSPVGDNGGVNNLPNFLRYVFGNPSGPSGRPVSMLSFLIDGQHWPPNIASYKYTNIMIHALNGVVLAWLALILFHILGLDRNRSAIFALLVAALWLLHPLNSTTTLYVVQRMAQLMTLFALTALICYLKGRLLILRETKRGLLLLCLALFPFGLLSMLSKENGALLLLLIVVFELSVFQRSPTNNSFKLWFRCGVILPLAALGLYLVVTFPASVAEYDLRQFSMLQRLLSETRVLTTYIGKLFLPMLVDAQVYHDDFQVSRSLFAPLSTLGSLIFLLAILVTAIACRRKQPMFFFGVAWFFVMHLLESTYLPLDLYFEHRNYLAMVGPLLSLVWYLSVFMQAQSPGLSKNIAMSVTGIVLLTMAWLSWQQSMLWGNSGNLLAHWAQEQPDSVRAQITYADFLAARGATGEAMKILQKVNQSHPKEITILLHMWNSACEYGSEAPYNLQQIAAMDGLEYYHNDINFHLRKLIHNLIVEKCEFPDQQSMISLFDSFEGLIHSDTYRAGYHFLYSDLFVHYRRLNSALIQLSKAFDLSGLPEIPIRQAMLTASAGNNADALIFLERARAADAQQSSLLPSHEPEIAIIERDIKNRMN